MANKADSTVFGELGIRNDFDFCPSLWESISTVVQCGNHDTIFELSQPNATGWV